MRVVRLRLLRFAAGDDVIYDVIIWGGPCVILVVGDLQNLTAPAGSGQFESAAVCAAIVMVACAWLTVKHESSRRRSE